MIVKDALLGIYYLHTFKSCTDMPRWMEIFYGVGAWYLDVVIFYVIYSQC